LEDVPGGAGGQLLLHRLFLKQHLAPHPGSLRRQERTGLTDGRPGDSFLRSPERHVPVQV
jgi:hypothetical protein